MLDAQNQGPQYPRGSPMRLAVIEASMSGQDLRTFCPKCEREFSGTSTAVTIKRGQRQNSRSLGFITRHVADNRTRSIHG